VDVSKNEDIFEVKTSSGNSYFTKNVVVSSGGTSFSQVGTT